MKKVLGQVAVLAGIVGSCFQAQAQDLPAFKPTHEQMVKRYKDASIRDSVVRNTIYRSSVNAHWLPGDKQFWYCNILKDSVTEYLLVESSTGKKKAFFDKAKLAKALEANAGVPVVAEKLLLDKLVAEKPQLLEFSFQKKTYRYDVAKDALTKVDSITLKEDWNHQFNYPYSRWASFATDSLSPDGKYAAFIKNNNVFVQHVQTGKLVQYTKDGSDAKPYGSLAWSPDSKSVVGYHITPVVDSPVYYILTSVANTTRGQLRSQEYKQPGDPFTSYAMYVFPVASETAIKVSTDTIDFFDAPELHWAQGNSHFYFEKVDRGHQRFRIIEVDVLNGNTRSVVDEQTKTFIYTNRIYTHYLPATHEIIWSSEKDGWQHLYLVDASTGKQKNEITKGNYVVREVDSVDVAKREIWFSASGMNAGEDPYYLHYYRIGFDGNHLVDLTPAIGNHSIKFSPGKKYYVDTYSQVNVAPVVELRAVANGKKIVEVEKADISTYMSVVKRLPTPFVAKARDGVTDIYGVYLLPADFDSTKKYPVIENIYAGPQDAFVPKSFIGYYREMQSLADLGFVVVQMDGMGTANRSKAFHDVCWQNLADAGFPDRINWMKALAAAHPYVDVSRVGLYGTSAGGQNALGGLLFHPEFYKAAVAACGCHDNRVDKQWWNEQWMGYPIGPWYAEQSNVTNAYKLKGKLMLIVGEADTNVPPESTYRVADALIKAKKTFDFLSVPGMGHSDGGPYGRIRKRDFFVQHLLGVIPPDHNNNETSLVN